MNSLQIRPAVPPELSCFPENQNVSALENQTCIELLRKNHFSKGILLNWAPQETSQECGKRKKSSIYIPSTNLGGKPIIMKLINDMRNIDGIIFQSSQQVHDLDRFFSDSVTGEQFLPCYFLFIVTVKETKSAEVENEEKFNTSSSIAFEDKIEEIKMRLLSNCQSVGLKKLALEVKSVTRLDNNNCLTKDQKKIMAAIANDCTDELPGEPYSPFIKTLVNSTPQFKYLELSGVRYNHNEFETNEGFTLKSLEGVVNVFKNFFSQAENEICFFPDFDSTPGSVLESTTETGCLDVSNLDGFMGEEIDFSEKLLGRLKKPKGLLIRRYSAKELNFVLKSPYTLNFEFDYILCSTGKFYGFEVSRSKILESPKSCIQRKLCSVFSKMLPKFCFILASWLYHVDLNLNFEQRTKFIEDIVEFVLYFTNISTAEVKDCLRNCQGDMKKTWNVLEETPADVIQKVTILCQENCTFDSKPPTSYKLVKNGSFWTLESSNITTTEIFSGRRKTNANYSKLQFDLSQYLSGLLSFGFLVQNFSIKEPQSRPLDWHSKMNVEQSICPNIILSPQQKKVLKLPHRYLFLLGEPGCGKTMLLYAKAIEAAKDPSVDHVVFFYPDTKTEFKINLEQFIENANSALLKQKAQIIKFTQLNNSMPRINLSRAVVLGDELYLDSDETYSESDSHWLRTTNLFNWLPMMKQCWMTKTEAGQDSKKKVYRVSLPHFQTQTLNVLFRCSWHIGRFCTSILHQNKAISKSTAWAHGCTKSSQYKVHIDQYSNLMSLNAKISSCQELRCKFEDSRMTVIFTNAGKELDWYSRLSKNRFRIGKIFVVSDRMSFYDLPFTGVERNSVLLIIDFCTWNKDRQEKIQNTVKFYNLAASRAQFELCVFVRDSQVQKLVTFVSSCETNLSSIVTSARLGLPVDLGKILNDQKSKKLVARANILFQIAVERENKELARAVVEKIGSKNIEPGQFLICMDVPKTPKFLEFLTEIMGASIRSVFSNIYKSSRLPKGHKRVTMLVDLINIAIRMGLMGTANWIISVIGEKFTRFVAIKSRKIVFSACNNGSYQVVEWAVNTIEKYGSLETELEGAYDTWTDEKVTLLLFLCHMNIDDMRSIQLLREKKFPVRLLRKKFEGRNVLEKAILYNNLEMARELLKEDVWARKLLPSEEKLFQLIIQTEKHSEMNELLNERFQELSRNI